MGQYNRTQIFYLNVTANEKWGPQQGETADAFHIHPFDLSLSSIQLGFQDLDIIDSSVINLVNTLVNKWNPPLLQHCKGTCAVLSLNLLYNYNIDVAGVCALRVLMKHFSDHVHATISCDAFHSPHLYSDGE